MLKSSATILSCSLKGNVGKRGGGLRITQGGIVNIMGGVITENKAEKEGGGIHLTNFSGLEATNCMISHNDAPLGGGAYIQNLLPVGFLGVKFDENSAKNEGSSLYLCGYTPSLEGTKRFDYQNQTILVTIQNCEFNDENQMAISSKDFQQTLFIDTCDIPSLSIQLSGASICGCVSGAKLNDFFLDSSSFTTDNDMNCYGNFVSPEISMTGVTYQNCISPPSFREETKNHVTVNLYGTGSVGDLQYQIHTTSISWVNYKVFNISCESFFLGLDSGITNYGELNVFGNCRITCNSVINNQNASLFMGSNTGVLAGTLEQRQGKMISQINLDSYTHGEDAPYSQMQDTQGGTLYVDTIANSPPSLGDKFFVLGWANTTGGVFDEIKFISPLKSGTRANFTYTDSDIECEIV